MLRKEGSNVYAVLNDLDRAINADIQGQPSKESTKTMPFMAVDLLEKPPTVHMYRHDLESLFYVLVWITSRFHKGKEIEFESLRELVYHTGRMLGVGYVTARDNGQDPHFASDTHGGTVTFDTFQAVLDSDLA